MACRVIGVPPDECCFCGGLADAGIFVRHNPGELTCLGMHTGALVSNGPCSACRATSEEGHKLIHNKGCPAPDSRCQHNWGAWPKMLKEYEVCLICADSRRT